MTGAADPVFEGSLRLRLRVRGCVQGVGFRPFVYRLAERFGLTGYVRNDAEGVVIEAEGPRLRAFLDALRNEAPPLARIDSVDAETLAPRRDKGFAILDSLADGAGARLAPDAAVCEDCLEELFEQASRFHLYPFVSCAHCGPRFTIAASLPYDRARTAMAAFAQCPACDADYRDPGSRRFHTEAIACPACGPRLSHSPAAIVDALRQGAIVAVKGVGGFHLMCDAHDETAVAALRRRKARDAKPFVVMAANVASVGLFAAPTEAERDLLRHRAAPIVLLRGKGRLAPSIAPGLSRVGVMLPYAPLHHMLFHAAAGSPPGRGWRTAETRFALVVTSANPGGEPLVAENAEAHRRLGGVADLIVSHDRAIVARADDSVMCVVDGAPAFLRRARGFVPEPIDLGDDGPATLAVGGHLKTTVTVTRGREAFVSPHIGDLDNAASVPAFEETVRHFLALLDVAPEIVACDLHPDFFTTRFAEELDLPLFRVQHHAAHVAAIAAEHRVREPVLGVALDGYGLGDDGGAWGGELLRLDGAGWRRLGHLTPLALPGGERAAREPWRMGLAALAKIGRLDRAAALFPDAPLVTQLTAALRRGAGPTTTSMGRLFDAAAALAGVCRTQRHEGQAAMEFEALATAPRAFSGGFRLVGNVLDFTPLLAFIALERPGATDASDCFHGVLIEGLAAWIAAAAQAEGLRGVALGGGCLMNRILAEGLASALRERGLAPLLARAAPCNDGGLSLGQAAMARAAFQARGREKESAACAWRFPCG